MHWKRSTIEEEEMIRRKVPSQRVSSSAFGRSAFTLVEMLVAIALVVLMMTLFTQIFGLAAGVMSSQKGISENDQRARMLTNVLRNDLDKRTFRKSGVRGILPIQPGVTGDPGSKGYFYIGENITTNDSDDVLQFTIQTNIAGTTRLTKPSPLYGKTQFIKASAATLTTSAGDPTGQLGYLDSNPDQPEADDGERFISTVTTAQNVNGTGASEYAEIAYFMRGKNLYRRVMLIRRPLKETYADQPSSGSPPTTAFFTGPTADYNPSLVPNTIPNGSGYFWCDFDYSAYYDFTGGGLKFHGLNSLDNNQPTMTAPVTLGIPKYRFGFNPATGQPVEFVNGKFIGRFTQQETSSGSNPPLSNPQLADFTYPGEPGWGPNNIIGDNDDTNPLTRTDLTLNPNNVVETAGNRAFDGPRVQEDLVLTNVHAFDIKVWDPGFTLGVDNQPGVAGTDDDGVNGPDDIGELGFPGSDDLSGANLNDFLDLGHGQGAPKLFGGQVSNPPASKSANLNFGNAFDTWHCSANAAGDSTLPYDPTVGGMKAPLQAIQIKIRYVDVASDQMREITLIQSLVD